MSKENVRLVIGKIIADPKFADNFKNNPEQTLDPLDLTPRKKKESKI